MQSEEWDALMIEIFGAENLEDDHLTEEENEVIQPGIPMQPTKKSRNTFRSPTAKKKKMMSDVDREVNKLMDRAKANEGERLMNTR
jgi:hypothetical protein